MPQFEILQNQANEKLRIKKFYEERFATLGLIPYKSGVFILEFPNGKSYVGSTKNLRLRIREIFIELFPKPQTIASRRRNGKELYKERWIGKVKAENLELKTYKDLIVKYRVCEDFEEEKLRILSKIDRDMTYN